MCSRPARLGHAWAMPGPRLGRLDRAVLTATGHVGRATGRSGWREPDLILSHDYKFVFIKTNKTAGTSVEIALSRFCGPGDIVTPISPEDEDMRRSLGFTGAQNYLAPRGPLSAAVDRILRRSPEKAFFNHMSAQQVRALIPAETWTGYFKFCIERNPWDRVVSSYFWKNKKEPRPSILNWLEQGGHDVLRRRGRDLYMIDGKIVVDHVVRYETLREDLESVRQKLGMPEPLHLPHAKSSTRTDRRHYRDILGEAERRIVERDFAFEIETFGYEF